MASETYGGPANGSRIAPDAVVHLAHEPPFRLGDLEIVPATRQVKRAGVSRTFEPRVLQVLVVLAHARGEVVSRDDLVERCWAGRIVGDDAINRCIGALRQLSREGPVPPFSIETVPRVGYRLLEGAALRESHDGGSGNAAGAFGLRRAAEALLKLPRRRTGLAAAALLVVLFAATVLEILSWQRSALGQRAPVSLAVMPFRNLASGDNYFAEGVAEEILSQLAREPQLRVAGRTSSWLLRDQAADAGEIGRTLHVDYLLEGSVRREGNRLRIDVSLVDTHGGMRMWSQPFQGTADDIFALQSKIGSDVVAKLRRELVHAAPTSGSLTTRGDVYALYLTARGLIRSRDPARVQTADELLRRALRLDPNYAPAWASLAEATMLRGLDWSRAPAEQAIHAEAARYANRARALAPDLAEAHAVLALVDDYRASTLPEIERAVQLEPGNAEYLFALMEAELAVPDYDAALRAIRRAAEIDPFWIRSENFSRQAWDMGLHDEALGFERRLIDGHPDAAARELARARAASYRWDWSGAYEHIVNANRIAPANVQVRRNLEGWHVLARLGFIEDARKAFPLSPMFWRMQQGKAPSRQELDQLKTFIGGAPRFWNMPLGRPMISRLLLAAGRGAELLDLFYDPVFGSPEIIAARHPMGVTGFLEDSPYVAVALRDAGRGAEAERMLTIADRMIAEIRGRGRVPAPFLETAARSWALEGKRELALRALERAVAMGWEYDHLVVVPRLADEPYYRSLRGEPRLRRLDDIMQTNIARERRELQAAGI